MSTALNIRDIGEERKAALEAEARAAGVSASEMVRRWIDAGISQAQAERERAAWVAAAKAGLAEEAERLERDGPVLARLRGGPDA
jgi:hypothetical protein